MKEGTFNVGSSIEFVKHTHNLTKEKMINIYNNELDEDIPVEKIFIDDIKKTS